MQDQWRNLGPRKPRCAGGGGGAELGGQNFLEFYDLSLKITPYWCIPLSNLALSRREKKIWGTFVPEGTIYAVYYGLTLEPITYRNIACIDLDAFVGDILKSKLSDTDCFNDLDSAVDIYESELSSILDKHAKEKTFIQRKGHNAEWWSTHCQQAKAMRRKLERLYQKNPDCPDTKRLYRKTSERASSVIVSTRDHFYKTRLQDSAGEKTYSIVNKLLRLRQWFKHVIFRSEICGLLHQNCLLTLRFSLFML